MTENDPDNRPRVSIETNPELKSPEQLLIEGAALWARAYGATPVKATTVYEAGQHISFLKADFIKSIGGFGVLQAEVDYQRQNRFSKRNRYKEDYTVPEAEINKSLEVVSLEYGQMVPSQAKNAPLKITHKPTPKKQ